MFGQPDLPKPEQSHEHDESKRDQMPDDPQVLSFFELNRTNLFCVSRSNTQMLFDMINKFVRIHSFSLEQKKMMFDQFYEDDDHTYITEIDFYKNRRSPIPDQILETIKRELGALTMTKKNRIVKKYSLASPMCDQAFNTFKLPKTRRIFYDDSRLWSNRHLCPNCGLCPNCANPLFIRLQPVNVRFFNLFFSHFILLLSDY